MPMLKLPDGYHTWQGMIRRCESPGVKNYDIYGGRGIRVCERWRRSFRDFMADMGPRPSPKHSIERVDTNGNYEPGNCQWATMKKQQNNRRNNRIITFQGKSQNVTQWAEEMGIPAAALFARLRTMTVDEAMTFRPPVIEYAGRRLNATEWSAIVRIKPSTIAKRIERGWSAEDALETPVRPWGR